MEKKNNYFEAELVFDSSVSEELKEEIINVLSTTKFNKISYPISTYLNSVNPDAEAAIDKVVTTGYIKKFIKDDKKFIFAIFNNNKEAIKAFKNPKVKVTYTEYDGKLGTITKIIVVDA